MLHRRFDDEIRLGDGGLIVAPKRLMPLHQQPAQPLQITGSERCRSRPGTRRLGDDVPSPRHQRRRKPALHLRQISQRELGQIAEAGTPIPAERQRLLAFAAPLIQRAPGEPVRQPGLHDPEPAREGTGCNVPVAVSNRSAEPALAVRGNSLIHSAAADPHLVILGAKGHLGQLTRREPLARQQAQRLGRGHGERGG